MSIADEPGLSVAGDLGPIADVRSVGLTNRLLTASRIGTSNRGRVLETLHRSGPASRAQLARALNVNRATIASILQPLIDTGKLVEGPPVAASRNGGKPARPLWFSHDGPLIGGVQLSPDFVAAALMGIDGSVRRQVQVDYERTATSQTISAAISEATAGCFSNTELIGIGVAAAGMVNTHTGSIISMHLNHGLDGLDVRAALKQQYDAPVLVDHHPRVQALGDLWFGLGRGVQNFASVYTGEALGFGIVYRDKIVRGREGAGGESGHTTVQIDGQLCRCGRTGCWETVATLGWLCKKSAQMGLDEAATMTSEKLAAQSDDGNAHAAELMDLYARNLAVGMANNEQVLASGTYIMHGDVCGGGPRMLSAVQGWMTRLAPERGMPPLVLFAEQPDIITLLGGAGLVLSSTFATTV
ncbi:ROK family transcriptional regulator [Arthrobacter sp. H14-L1]|uniref:ROK family transcriptional regulator n=1 Tax=Arthrobacter sp. H14-L1 TaxID=2996697 RepID=UPI0022712587|nr:ROK family transcriptional regulator [Arthrobacter sp. H14-L1]MCY0906271.1 ROK family transcriptional regulator [Arthrobacter sp. H14-L1]